MTGLAIIYQENLKEKSNEARNQKRKHLQAGRLLISEVQQQHMEAQTHKKN